MLAYMQINYSEESPLAGDQVIGIGMGEKLQTPLLQLVGQVFDTG